MSALSYTHGSRVHTQSLRSHREWTKSVQVTPEASKKGQQRGCNRLNLLLDGSLVEYGFLI